MNNHKRAELRARLCAACDMLAGNRPFVGGVVPGSAWSVWYENEYRALSEATKSEIKHRVEELEKNEHL